MSAVSDTAVDISDQASWPVEIMRLHDFDRTHVVIHHFKACGQNEDAPILVLLPDVILDGRTSFARYLSHPLVAPIMRQFNVVIANYPHQAQIVDCESYDESFKFYPSFNSLSGMMQEVVTRIQVEHDQATATIGMGVGMGASLLMHMATTSPGLFSGIIPVSPPPIREMLNERFEFMVTQLTATTEQPKSAFTRAYIARWARRWFNEGEARRVSDVTVDEFKAAFSCRMPAHTSRAINSYFLRPEYRVDIRCPTLVLNGADLNADHTLRNIHGLIRDVTVVPIRGRGLAHIESPRETVVHLLPFLAAAGVTITVPRNLLVSAERDVRKLLRVVGIGVRATIRMKAQVEEAKHDAIKGVSDAPIEWAGHWAARPVGVDSTTHTTQA